MTSNIDEDRFEFKQKRNVLLQLPIYSEWLACVCRSIIAGGIYHYLLHQELEL